MTKQYCGLILSLVTVFSYADEVIQPYDGATAYLNLNAGIAKIFNLPTAAFAGSFNAGYNFNRGLALEGGYTILPSSQYGATVTSNIFDAAVKGTVPLSSVFNLYGRLGLGFGIDGWSGTATNPPSWFCNGQYNSTYPALLVGIGGSFTLSKHFDLRLEDYAFTPFTNTLNGGINVISFGSQYNF